MEFIIGGLIILGISGSVWGSQTLGSWSRNISIIGGILWLSSVILSFYLFGFKTGLILLFVSFIIGAIEMRIFPKKI